MSIPPTAETFVNPHSHNVPSDSDDEDKIVATYDVYLTPAFASFAPPAKSSSATLRPTHLIQYPTRRRHEPYNAARGRQPSNFRVKPRTGHVEIDVSLNSGHRFNSPAAKKWTKALKAANAEGNRQRQSGGKGAERSAGFGAANGFIASGPLGVKGPRKTLPENEAADEGEDDQRGDSDGDTDAMETQTLGGQFRTRRPQGPNLFVGAFKNDKELHLTGVTGVAQVRPQFHHIDANTQIAKYPAATMPAGKEQKPRLVHTTHKTQGFYSRGLSNDPNASIKDMLVEAAEEPWSTLEWQDEDEEVCFEVFRDRMFSVPQADTETEPQLKSQIAEEKWLDGVSAGLLERRRSLEKRRRRQRVKVKKEPGADSPKKDRKGKGKAKVPEPADETAAEATVSEDSTELSEVDEDISDHVEHMSE